ncbi:MAG: glycosyltransferase family 39 protein [Acetatifactor sp.]|nr:glycosyltransferase family 39 protein [Acetatifactor sp.]
MAKLKAFLKQRRVILGILILASAVRLIGLGSWPDGWFQDEAYAAYNAWALMTEGIDSWGYHFPVYFVAWGSGMSVLYSYVAALLFRLFGSNLLVFRLPQAILGILSVYAMYRLASELWDERFGRLAALVLAINPWHIMNTRYALDANMAPGMFIFGALFLVYGLRKSHKYLVLSAIFLGLTLYCYALTWLIIPVFLLLFLLLYFKEIPRKWTTLLALAILFLMAIPLMLFLLINHDYLPEIRTSFLSIPKLIGYRGAELNFRFLTENHDQRVQIILEHQYDDVAYTASDLVGAYYLFTTPLWLFGVVNHLYRLVRNWKFGRNSLELVPLLWLVSAFGVCSLHFLVSMIHFNMVHIPIIFYGAYGLYRLAEILRNKALVPVCLAFWCISFVLFGQRYITEPCSYYYNNTTDEAIEAAKEIADGRQITIFGWPTVKYSILLWHELPRVSYYYQNVVYTGDPKWQEIETFEQFHYIADYEDWNEVTEDGIYIIYNSYEEMFRDLGFELEMINDRYAVAVGPTALTAIP